MKMQININTKVRISGRVFKVISIQGDVCEMVHANGCSPARHCDRFKDLGFLQNFGKPSNWKPELKPLSELLMSI